MHRGIDVSRKKKVGEGGGGKGGPRKGAPGREISLFEMFNTQRVADASVQGE